MLLFNILPSTTSDRPICISETGDIGYCKDRCVSLSAQNPSIIHYQSTKYYYKLIEIQVVICTLWVGLHCHLLMHFVYYTIITFDFATKVTELTNSTQVRIMISNLSGLFVGDSCHIWKHNKANDSRSWEVFIRSIVWSLLRFPLRVMLLYILLWFRMWIFCCHT